MQMYHYNTAQRRGVIRLPFLCCIINAFLVRDYRVLVPYVLRLYIKKIYLYRYYNEKIV